MSYAAYSIQNLEPWQRMWLIAIVIYCLCKAVSLRRVDLRSTTLRSVIAYTLLWPGLDPIQFLHRPTPLPPKAGEWLFAVSKTAIGAATIWVALPSLLDLNGYLRGWIGLVGLGLLMHFGLFHIISCLWRAVGHDAKPLMNWPIASASVTEFWEVAGTGPFVTSPTLSCSDR